MYEFFKGQGELQETLQFTNSVNSSVFMVITIQIASKRFFERPGKHL